MVVVRVSVFSRGIWVVCGEDLVVRRGVRKWDKWETVEMRERRGGMGKYFFNEEGKARAQEI